MRRYPKISFDMLQMYFRQPYVIDVPDAHGTITVYQPSIGDIVNIGEQKFYKTLSIFINNTTVYRLPLWEAGVDWNEISDFDLFTALYKLAEDDVTKLIFGDLNLKAFDVYEKKVVNDGKEIIVHTLYNEEDDIEINESVYQHFHQYLQIMFNMFPEEKITTDAIMKRWFIDKDKRQVKIDEEKAKKGKLRNSASIQQIISACVNHSGFKYKLQELKDVGVYEFYDSVLRLQIYENSTALLKGMYSGFISTKDINPDSYNWMKQIDR